MVLVTPSDTTDLSTPGHIRADGAGAIRCLPDGAEGTNWVEFTMAAGETTQVVVRRVYDTGTDIATLHVLY
jgi:hypothetical protein